MPCARSLPRTASFVISDIGANAGSSLGLSAFGPYSGFLGQRACVRRSGTDCHSRSWAAHLPELRNAITISDHEHGTCGYFGISPKIKYCYFECLIHSAG